LIDQFFEYAFYGINTTVFNTLIKVSGALEAIRFLTFREIEKEFLHLWSWISNQIGGFSVGGVDKQ